MSTSDAGVEVRALDAGALAGEAGAAHSGDLDGEADAGPDFGPQVGLDAGLDAGPEPGLDAGPDGGPVVIPPPENRTGIIIKVILGLSILLVLAYIGSHPWVRDIEERIGIAHVITAGFPFVALGLVAHHPAVGVLSDDVLEKLTPILNFGLGWLGFIIGLQLDVRLLDRLPRGTGLLVVIEASTPLVVITLACGGLMILFGQDYRDPAVIRDALMLGAAGAMTATRGGASLGIRPWTLESWRPEQGVRGLVSQLDEIAGIAGLMVLAAFYRPTGFESTWQLPGTAWVFVTLGLGATIGVLMYVIVRSPRSGAEFLAVMLGFIAFASGLAGYLRLSPIVVCFFAGILLTNFPCEQRDNLMKLSTRLERPIHLVFLIIAGALWSVGDWRGWVLVPCFVAARLGGRVLGVVAGRRTFEAQGRALPTHGPLVTPLSVLSLALVVSVDRLYQGGDSDTIAWVMTAVIGGAMCTEILVQLLHTPPAASPTAIADGASSGPVYRDPGHDPGRDLDGGSGGLPVDPSRRADGEE